MTSTARHVRESQAADREFFVGLARASAGALIFSLPMLMTMEMWWIGFYVSPWRLVLLVLVSLPVLLGLSRFVGFEPTSSWREDLVDVFVALLVAAVAATGVLWLFGLLSPAMSARELIGKITLQCIPGSIGAMLARSQLGVHSGDAGKAGAQDPSYGGELFLMGVGALFLSFNVAPTEEMVLIAFKMSVWQEVALLLLSLLLMHGFVYSVSFRGSPHRSDEATSLGLFLRFTVVGYAIVLLVSLYVLWTFGRTDGMSSEEMLSAAVVLGFPGAIGAAAARLIL